MENVGQMPGRKGCGPHGLGGRAEKKLRDLIPLQVMENEEYFFIEGDVPGFKAEELTVSLTSRIVTISVRLEGNPDRGRKEMSFSIYLDSPVAPAYGTAIFSRGRLYLKMLKDPTAAIHSRVNLPVCG